MLLSETRQGLQNQLDALETFSESNSLSINIKKTKSLCFNKSGKLIRNCFMVNQQLIEDVKLFKYLGFVFTAWGGLKTGLADLHDRGQKAFYKLKKSLGYGFMKYPRVAIKLYEAIVKQILLYASDYWGAFENKTNPIEQVHISFCKQMLGLSKRATNNASLIEVGFAPLKVDATKRAVRNWLRISVSRCNSLMSDAYNSIRSVDFHWGKNIENILNMNGFPHDGDLELKEKFVNVRLPSILRSKFNVDALAQMSSDSSKMNLYASLIKSAGSPEYIGNVNCVTHRILLTKVRMSDHTQNIETLRHAKVPKCDRFCIKCPGTVEDEKHFLLHCELYKDITAERDSKIKVFIPSFHTWIEQEKMITMLNAKGEMIPIITDFIAKAEKKRNNYLEFLRFSVS